MQRADFLTKLELVGTALSTTNMVPIYQSFMFDGKVVRATNDVLGIQAPCSTEQPFAVNGQVLLKLLRKTSADGLEILIEENDVVLKSGRSTFKLPYLTEDSFIFEKPNDKPLFSLPITDELVDGIEACLTTSSKDNTQPVLMGICIHQDKKVLLYSCDSDALTRYATGIKGVEAEDVILPNEFCESLLKIIKSVGLNKAGNSMIDIGPEWARASLEKGFVMYGRLLKNANPPLDHGALIKKRLKEKADYVSVPAGLGEALERASVVAEAESTKTVLTVEQGRLKLLTESGSLGTVRDSIACKDHAEVQANVYAELITRALRLCDQICIFEDCCAFKSGDSLFQLVSNLGR